MLCRSPLFVVHLDLVLDSLLLTSTASFLLGSVTVSVTSGYRVIVLRAWNFTGELFEGLALGLGDQQSREATQQHEQCENLENMIQPWGWVGGGRMPLDSERANDDLSDDGTDLSGCSRKTVGCRTVSGREAFSRDDERCGVGTEIEEK